MWLTLLSSANGVHAILVFTGEPVLRPVFRQQINLPLI